MVDVAYKNFILMSTYLCCMQCIETPLKISSIHTSIDNACVLPMTLCKQRSIMLSVVNIIIVQFNRKKNHEVHFNSLEQCNLIVSTMDWAFLFMSNGQNSACTARYTSKPARKEKKKSRARQGNKSKASYLS